MRADLFLVQLGLAESREQAQRFITAGKVFRANGNCVRKPAENIPEDEKIACEGADTYVSRGAYKLIPALDRYCPDCRGKIAIDIGASTGGFTDLLCQRGAKKVYAVDTGENQLHPKLQANPAVVSMEKVNARRLLKKDFTPAPHLCVMDVSFISATLLLPSIDKVCAPDALIFILIKPQFEVGKANIGRNGVVKESWLHTMSIDKVTQTAETSFRWTLLDVTPSPIQGPQGNQEFIAVFRKPSPLK